MKKILLGLVAAAALLATSCDKNLQEGPVAADGTAKVSVNLKFPEMQTRAYSDGTTATQLQYAVYEKTSGGLALIDALTHSIDGNNAETINIRKQVDFQLVTGRTYTFVFWAASVNAPYEVKFEESKATMAYKADATLTANDENLDAFYTHIEKTITGDVNMTAELYRPFAQINVGTSDYDVAEEQNGAPTVSSIVVENAYTTLNLIDDEASESKAINFNYGTINDDEVFPYLDDVYDYLAMTYVLVNKKEEADLVEVTFKYAKDVNGTEEQSRKVGSVPVNRNHRTNMFGQILTSTASVNVIIKPEYEEPDYNYDQLLFAAAVGGTAVLDDDVNLNNHGDVLTFTRDAVIDLNGKTITGFDGKDGAITVTKGANVTIKGNGKIVSNDEKHSTVIFVKENSSVTIEGGYYEGQGDDDQLIYCEAGTIYIKGGTFKLPDYNYTLNCYDTNAKNGTAKFVVTGGTFWKFDPSNSIAEGKNPTYNWVPAGYKSVKTTIDGDDWYVVVPETIETVTSDLTEAANALKDGGNVALASDIETEGVIGQGYGNNYGGVNVKGGVLDGNGNTLMVINPREGGNSTWDCVVTTNGGTIKNLTIKSDGTMCKGLLAWSMTSDLYVDNVHILPDSKLLYGINIDSSNGYNVYVSNSTFCGWNSWGAGVPYTEYKNCKFGIGTYYNTPNNLYNGLVKPYNTTLFENCEFDENIYMDFSAVVNGATIEFKNCTVNGTLLTEENHKIMAGYLFDDLDDWEDYDKVKSQIVFSK